MNGTIYSVSEQTCECDHKLSSINAFLEPIVSSFFICVTIPVIICIHRRRHKTKHHPLWGSFVRNSSGFVAFLLYSLIFLERLIWKNHGFIAPLLSAISCIIIFVLYDLIDNNKITVHSLLYVIIIKIIQGVASVLKIVPYCCVKTSVFFSLHAVVSSVIFLNCCLDVASYLQYILYGQYTKESIKEGPRKRKNGRCEVSFVSEDFNFSCQREAYSKKLKYVHKNANFFSKCTFWWYNTVINRGRKKPLEFYDVDSVSEAESCSVHSKKFMKQYMQNKSLWHTFLKCYWKNFLCGGILKLLADSVNVIGPLAIVPIVNYVKQLEKGQEVHAQFTCSWSTFLSNGWVIGWLALIASLFQSVFSQGCTHFMTISGIHVRSALQVLIYKKSFRIALKNKNIEDENEDNDSKASKIINLTSNDTDNILSFFTNCHYVWAIPLKMIILLSLLYLYMGPSAIYATLIAIMILFPLQFVLIKNISSVSHGLAESGDARLQKTQEAVMSLKHIKVNNWENVMINRVLKEREKELGFLKKDTIYRAMMIFLTQSIGIIIVLLTFVLHSITNEEALNSGNIFASLALFSQLTVPLFILPSIIVHSVKAKRSVTRIEEFLNSTEVSGISDENGSCDGSHEKQSVISFSKADFSVEGSSAILLKNIDVNFYKGDLTVILGDVGCGKSSFLLSLMGELKNIKGQYSIRKEESFSYVSQTPWLLNCSLKENIVFGKSYNHQRYQKVINICSLLPDIQILPYGDETKLGQGGILLSGGQRQRVAIARALYFDSSIVLMDSSFSALDSVIAKSVFEECIKYLKRKGKTVIITTNHQQFAKYADHIIYLSDGEINLQGSPETFASQATELWKQWMTTYTAQPIAAAPSTDRERQILRQQSRVFTLRKRRKLSRADAVDIPEEEFSLQRHTVMSSLIGRQALLPENHNINFNPLDNDSFVPPMILRSTSNDNVISKSTSKHLCIMPRKSARSFTLSRLNSTKINGIRMEPDVRKSLWNFPTFKRKKSIDQEKQEMQRVSLSSQISSDDDYISDDENACNICPADPNTEDRARGRISKTNYLLYFKACMPFVIVYVLFSFVNQGASIATDIWLGYWSNRSEGAQQTNTQLQTNEEYYFLSIFIAFSVISIITAFVTILFAQLGALKGSNILYIRLLASVMYSSSQFIENTPAGRIISRFSSDTTMIDKELGWALMHMVFFTLLCGSSIVLNIIISPIFIFVSIPICFTYYIVQHIFRNCSRELKRLENLALSPMFGLIAETASAPVVIRAYEMEEKFLSCYTKRVDTYTGISVMYHSGNRWLGIAMDFMGGVIVFLATMACLITITFNLNKSLTATGVGVALKYTLSIPIYLSWLVRFLSDTETGLSSIERIRNFIDLEHEEESTHESALEELFYSKPQKKAIFIDDLNHNENVSHSLDIEFVNVSLYYNEKEFSAIKNISFKIKPGEKVGICGRTGSGKSTIVMGILKLVQQSCGHIFVGGTDIENMTVNKLRNCMHTTLQEIKVFQSSIRYNLDPTGLFANKEDMLWNALRHVELNDLVNNLPKKLDSVVGTHVLLTPGQQQLLSLARIFLLKKPLILLDEATSALDPRSEERLLRTMKRELVNSTIVSVAHNVQSLMESDRILVIDDGQLVEDGNPSKLSQEPNSRFYHLLHIGSE